MGNTPQTGSSMACICLFRKGTEHWPPHIFRSVNAEQAVKAEWAAKVGGLSRRSRQMCAPTVWSTVQVTLRVTSSYTDLGGAAASLDSCIEEEGDCPFHQHHLDRVKYGGAKQATAVPSCQDMSTLSARKIDPLWRTRGWLEECEQRINEEEIDWWLLIHPLMDGAAYALAWRLMAMWHWPVKTSRPLICPPTPTILNIGQFLDKDIKKHR